MRFLFGDDLSDMDGDGLLIFFLGLLAWALTIWLFLAGDITPIDTALGVFSPITGIAALILSPFVLLGLLFVPFLAVRAAFRVGGRCFVALRSEVALLLRSGTFGAVSLIVAALLVVSGLGHLLSYAGAF